MAEVSLAQETRTVPAYVLRGAGLFEVYREQFEYLGAGRWSVPSGTVEGKSYVVRPGRHAQCECVGFSNHSHCSHIVAAELTSKKSAVCDSCGERRWYSRLTTVQEEDDLLSWIPGDILCRDCIRGGAWS